jgi:hypothetical protein
VEYLETELKTIFIWGYIISFPLLILLFYFTFGLSTGALITAGTYCLVNAAVSAFILRRVRRKDLVALDLNVLMEREKRYRKTFLIMLALTEVFWVAFAFTFMTTALGIIMLVILMLITVPRYYHSFVKAYKDGLQGKIEEQPSLLGRIGKIVGFTVLGILILALVAFAVLYIIAFFKTYQEIGFKDFAWVNYLYGLIALGFTVALITMLFETTGKNKGHRPSTFTIVLFSVSIFLYVASYLLDYFRNGVFDKSCLFMIAVSVVVISNFFKRKE